MMKTLKIPKLKIEVEVEIHCRGKKLAEIKIPKGWRLLKPSEIWLLFENEKYRKQLRLDNTWEFVDNPIKNGWVARFDADDDWADLYCGGGTDISYSSLGVRFCRSLRN